MAIYKHTRAGCRDIWNAFMVDGAQFSSHDIPYCPTTAIDLPNDIITWEEAKSIHKRKLVKGLEDYTYDAFVCFYADDYRFDGVREGVWSNPMRALKILKHFAGVITPDFSTYQDFPEPIKSYNTFRMRAFGYWLGINGIAVINNVRWGTPESYWYCFDGIPINSIVSIGTVGGSPWRIADRKRFEDGLAEMMRVLRPHTIIVYGSANYPCFSKLIDNGISIISFSSRTARAFEGRRRDV